MNPKDCALARMGLFWLPNHLADKASVPEEQIRAFEAGQPVDAPTVSQMRQAMESAGARF